MGPLLRSGSGNVPDMPPTSDAVDGPPQPVMFQPVEPVGALFAGIGSPGDYRFHPPTYMNAALGMAARLNTRTRCCTADDVGRAAAPWTDRHSPLRSTAPTSDTPGGPNAPKRLLVRNHSTKSNTALHQILEPDTGVATLPGGTPEEQDQGDLVSTLRREVDEEAAARLGAPLLLGHVTDPPAQRGYLRYAAALTEIGPARPDPVTGHTCTRVLATPEQALSFFDWGSTAACQLAAVHRARRQLGIPRAALQPVTELSAGLLDPSLSTGAPFDETG